MVSEHIPRVIIIGGGAAGFFGAIACAENLKSKADINILESGSHFLTKVKISGGGRCNVTHEMEDKINFVGYYPRGKRELIGPLSRWGQEDTVWWFKENGVELKTESDGRVFPFSDSSQTVINCLTDTAKEKKIKLNNKCRVNRIVKPDDGSFKIWVNKQKDPILADYLLLATGGIRSASSRNLLESVGHEFSSPVPSLFTFEIDDDKLIELSGLSLSSACVGIESLGIKSTGPLLITHWGISGPVVLKLSALGARELEQVNYQFKIQLNWLGEDWSFQKLCKIMESERNKKGARKILKKSPLKEIPNRLWSRIALKAGTDEEQTWSELTKERAANIVNLLITEEFLVSGKSLNKEEFVTCGGVLLRNVDLRTMESRLVRNLFFAGEVMDIDGLTGGFNFQSAWTTGRIAGEEIALRCCT
ncbi:aminoacetone oxidase family FAD-binding enzyme [Verrucomicrobiales bacterium]|nr:aminoacetone oxidase family FAD-binding enzyme [Verrucomicrobiales bacterium]